MSCGWGRPMLFVVGLVLGIAGAADALPVDTPMDVLARYRAGGEPLDVETDAAWVADGLHLVTGEVETTVQTGWMFPVISGRTDEAWDRQPHETDRSWPARGERPVRRVVGYVFVGHGAGALSFAVPGYAWEVANHLVADVHLPKDRLRPVAHDGAPLTFEVEAAVVRGSDPAVLDLVKALPLAALGPIPAELPGDRAALIAPEREAFSAAAATARRLWKARTDKADGQRIGLDRLRLERLGETSETARLWADILTDTGFGYVSDNASQPEYDRWLRVVVDPNGWYRSNARSVVLALGEHPTNGWRSRTLAITPQPPSSPTDPLSPPFPARRMTPVSLDTTVTLTPAPSDAFHLGADLVHRMTLRAVRGPIRSFWLSVPDNGTEAAARRIESLTLADGTRVTLQRPDELKKHEGQVFVVLPRALATAETATLDLKLHEEYGFGNFVSSDLGSLGMSSGLLFPAPDVLPSFDASWQTVMRVGVPAGTDLSVSISGLTTRRWEEGGVRWEEAETGKRGVYVGFAFGKWIETEVKGTDTLPAIRVHMFPDQRAVLGEFVPEMQRILSTYQGFLPRYAWPELELFQAPDGINGYLWIAPHGMVNLQSVRFFSDTGGNPFRDDSPHLESGVLAHEIAHQWWAHNTRAAQLTDGWINETFSETFSGVYVARTYGSGDLEARMAGARRLWTAEIEGAYARASLVRAYESGLQPYIVYQYGPYVMHKMLRPRIGDGAFFAVLDVFQREHAGQWVCTEQMLDAFRQAVTQDLSDFFRFWVWQGWLPAVELAWRSDASTFSATVTGDVPFGTFDVPVRITWKDGTTSTLRVDVVDGLGELKAPLAGGGVKDVELDPDGMILAKSQRVKHVK